MIRVVVAEDHETVREGLRHLLNAQGDMEVVGEAGDGRAAVEQACSLKPNVVVLDLARGLQGCAAGITWAASMAWLSANTPRERLSREAGIVMGLFSIGAVIGPGIGSFAHATSPELAFTCLAGAAALTIPLAWRAPVGVHVPIERR